MKIKVILLTKYVAIWLLFRACGLINDELIPEAEVLNLSKHGLTEIPEEVYGMKNLKVLKLYGNKIDSISPRIQELQSLEKLYIGKNRLTHFPVEIGELKNLKLLSAQYNDIRFLTSAVGKLENLEDLILNQNQLKALPVELGNLKQLKNLQVNFNFLTFLPRELGNCSSLQILMLRRNMIEELPESYGNLTSLKELYLAGAGNLVKIPDGFCDLRQLNILEIDRFTVVPPCMFVHKIKQLQIIVR